MEKEKFEIIREEIKWKNEGVIEKKNANTIA